MVDRNVYQTLLKEQVNPIIDKLSEDESLLSNPVIDLFDSEDLEGVETPESGKMDLYQFTSRPLVVIGDRWAYRSTQGEMKTGQIKFKKMTLQIRISDDQADRIAQLGVTSLIARDIKTQQKNNIKYAKETVEKWCIDPFGSVTTDEDYDGQWHAALKLTSGDGTLGNPSDLNGGTALDGSGINFSGTNEDVEPVLQLMNLVEDAMLKIDYITKAELKFDKVYIGMHPRVYRILNTQKSLKNSTSNQRAEMTQIQEIEAMGYTIVQSVWFDSDYSKSSGSTSTICFFGDPGENFVIYRIIPPDGEGWTEWDKEKNTDDGTMTESWEMHKKVEFACQAVGYWVMTSATAGSIYKAVLWATITPYENS